MFTSGSIVKVMPEKCVPVEHLKVGDRVIDPITLGYGTLVDVQVCEVFFGTKGPAQINDLRPVRIQAASLTSLRPVAPVVVSCDQPLMTVEARDRQNGPATINPRPCGALLDREGIEMADDLAYCKYVSLTFEEAQLVDVNGALFYCDKAVPTFPGPKSSFPMELVQ